MSELHRHVGDYLRLRRALGFKLRLHGDLLPHFADYLEAAGAATITTELAVSFAQLPQGVQPILWAHRLTMVRGFARYLKTIDPATEVPPLNVWSGPTSISPLVSSRSQRRRAVARASSRSNRARPMRSPRTRRPGRDCAPSPSRRPFSSPPSAPPCSPRSWARPSTRSPPRLA